MKIHEYQAKKIMADYGINTDTGYLCETAEEVYEAAELDHAGGWNKFFHITLPLLGRTTTFVVLMTLISYFQMFAQFSVLLFKDGPQNSGLVLTSYIYENAFVYKEMGYAAALSVVLFLLILIVSVVQQRINRVDWEY